MSGLFLFERNIIMNKVILAICVGFLCAISIVCSVNSIHEKAANSVIRLHIRANSNSKEDQELKLKVRDAILKEAKNVFGDITDIQKAREYAKESTRIINEIAKNEIVKNGYNYNVRTSFGKADFPTKTYGDMTLPAGTYEAMTVEIGSGEGNNWWCVMFPPLCFVEETVAVVDDKTEKILIQNMGKDTYSMLKDNKIQIKFKIYEAFKQMK